MVLCSLAVPVSLGIPGDLRLSMICFNFFSTVEFNPCVVSMACVFLFHAKALQLEQLMAFRRPAAALGRMIRKGAI